MGMLSLTRRVGESLIIGDDIKITVLKTRGNQIRIGIDAPKDVEVHREEIFERIHGKLWEEHIVSQETPK